MYKWIVMAAIIVIAAVFLMGCIDVDTDEGCGTCGNGNGEAANDTDHPAYHPTANPCGAHVYGFPDFSGTPREGEPCETSLDCMNHPPENIPDAELCCVNDGTCYREVEN